MGRNPCIGQSFLSTDHPDDNVGHTVLRLCSELGGKESRQGEFICDRLEKYCVSKSGDTHLLQSHGGYTGLRNRLWVTDWGEGGEKQGSR